MIVHDKVTRSKMKPEDGPWVSLPSKQYPSEVYYFNVSTGESSWEKPENYCEPVDDRTNLQCLSKPSTPERTENSYIVESLSPNTSPKKRPGGSRQMMENHQRKKNEEKDESCLQRNRSKLKDHPYKKPADVKRKDANDGKAKYYEKNVESDPYPSDPKHYKPIMKGDTPYASAMEGRLQSPKNKLRDSYVAGHKSICFEPYGGKFLRGKISEYDRSRGSHSSSFVKDKNELTPRRCLSSDLPIVYGSASLRLEQLKRKIQEERMKKCQQSQPDWPEYSSEKEWQNRLIKQRNSVGDEFRHSSVTSYFSSSSDSRKSYFSGSGNEPFRVRHVDASPMTQTSHILSDSSQQLCLSEKHEKPYFIRDSCHLKNFNDNMLSKIKYCESVSKPVVSDQLKLQSSLLPEKPYCRFGSGGYYSSSAFDKKLISNTHFPCSSSQTCASNLQQKYHMFPDKEYRKTGTDNSYLLQSERNLLLKPEISSLSRINVIDLLARYHKALPSEPYNRTGSVRVGIHSLESGRNLLSDTHISKTPSMDHLRQHKFMLLQANALRNQRCGEYSNSSELKYSSIGSFASTSDEFASGGKGSTAYSRDIKPDNSHENGQRKLLESLSYLDAPPKYSTSLTNQGKDVETNSKRSEINLNSWESNSRGFVRDYNHKRIADCVQQRTNTADVSTDPAYKRTVASSNLKLELACEKVKKRNSMPDQSAISAYSKYKQPASHPEKLRESLEILWGSSCMPKKNVQLGCTIEKNFGHGENERENKANHSTSTKVALTTNYHSSCITAEPKSSECSKTNSRVRDSLFQKFLKQKAYDSKGGITKINRRVQKQLRTATPKLVHLSSTQFQKNVLGSSLQRGLNERLNQNFKLTGSLKVDEEEEMDWEPIEPEKVVLHVEELRKEGCFQNTVNPELVNLCTADTEMLSQWFVVVDTNVLLSHLAFLRDLRDIKDSELGMPTLFIPWIVLQELDNLKSTNRKVALQVYARKAVNFLYDNLLSRHPRIRGQPKAEADEYEALEPDDSILQCSLNLKKRSSKVLLLTNDHNLFNKAIVNEVECCSAAKLLQELDSRRKLSTTPSTSSFSIADENKIPFYAVIQEIKQCITVVLEEVLRTEMVMVYDRDWSTFVARKPPWTLNDILFCLSKHWVAVFHHVLPSAARELIEKIRIFVNNEMYETSLASVENLVKTCISLMHLVSSLAYKQYVDNALKNLNKLQNSLKKQTKLSNSSPAVTTCVANNKIEDTLSRISAITRSGSSDSASVVSKSDSASVVSKGEQLTQSVVTGGGSSGHCGNDSSIINDSKIGTDDDCLSLYASSFSEDMGYSQSSSGSIERGQQLTQQHLNKIVEKVSLFCGVLCDVMGCKPGPPYQPPEPFPALETLHQSILPYAKCVKTLLSCMEEILSCQPNELRENSRVLFKFYSTIKESLPMWTEPGEALLPQHVLVYCTQTDTRQTLQCGKKQFEEIEAVFKQATTFFLGLNHPSTPLPSF